MIVADMMAPDATIFLKSEWGQISDFWPCLAFGKLASLRTLADVFDRDKDVLIYAGTQDPDRTEDPDHRKALVSGVVVEPKLKIETRQIVPPASWAAAQAGGRNWPFALPVARSFLIAGPPYPQGRIVCPKAYASLGAIQNRGYAVSVTDRSEQDAIRKLEAEEFTLTLQPRVGWFLAAMRDGPAAKACYSLANDLLRKAQASEVPAAVCSPRTSPSDLWYTILAAWGQQGGGCAACGKPLPKPLLGDGLAVVWADPGRPFEVGNADVVHDRCAVTPTMAA